MERDEDWDELMEKPINVTKKKETGLLSIGEKLCLFFQFNIVLKQFEINNVREVLDHRGNFDDLLQESNHLNRENKPCDDYEDFVCSAECPWDKVVEMKKRRIQDQQAIEVTDHIFQEKRYQEVLEQIYSRILTTEDKQFKLDIEDLIEE